MIKLIVGVALAAWFGMAAAQSFPTRPVTLIVPFPPGGSTDTTARLLAEAMRGPLGQSVVIENVGGAGGTHRASGAWRARRPTATPSTSASGTPTSARSSIPINYDLQKDFTPIGLMTINPQLMIARKDFPADDLKGLVAWLKANPDKATLVEQTAAAKLAGIQMMQMTGTKLEFIPFRGAGPAMQAMLGGQVDLMILQAAAALPQARAGTVKILANLSPQRSHVDSRACRPRTRAAFPASTPPAGSACSARAACRRKSSPSSMPPWCRRSPTPKVQGAPRATSASTSPRASSRSPEGARRVPEGRDRQVVAGDQGRQHQGRVSSGNALKVSGRLAGGAAARCAGVSSA